MSRFSYLKWTAVVAVLGMTVVAGVRPSTATKESSLPNVAAAGANISAEGRTLETYFFDLGSFNAKWVALGKKDGFTHAEFDPVLRSADDLKRRLSGVQNSVKEIIRKLKASGDWDNLDELVQAKITDAKLSSEFRQNSFKRLLEESSTRLTNDAGEISAPLEGLRSKLSARANDSGFEGNLARSGVRFVSASYASPAPVKNASFGCRVAGLHVGVQLFVRGIVNDKTLDAYECACSNRNCMVW
jgi:hypothetical protein